MFMRVEKGRFGEGFLTSVKPPSFHPLTPGGCAISHGNRWESDAADIRKGQQLKCVIFQSESATVF